MDKERGEEISESPFNEPNLSESLPVLDEPDVSAKKEAAGSSHDQSVESWEWDQHFLNGHDILQKKGVPNSPRTRVLIVSGTDEKVEEFDIFTAFTDEHLKNEKRLIKVVTLNALNA